VRLDIGQTAELNANRSVSQQVEIVPEWDKERRLFELLAEHGHAAGCAAAEKALVFLNTKNGCGKLCQEMQQRGLSADCLHGNRPQAEREAVMGAFLRGEIGIMVATDLAGRGIDVKQIGLVVNYEMPTSTGQQCMEDYVHRIGRTGRMHGKQKPGTAVTLFEPKLDAKVAHELVNVLKAADQPVPPGLAALDTGSSMLNAAQKRGLEKSHKKRGTGYGTYQGASGKGGGGGKGGGKGWGGGGWGGGW